MTFFIVVGLLILLYKFLKLQTRVDILEERLRRYETSTRAANVAPVPVSESDIVMDEAPYTAAAVPQFEEFPQPEVLREYPSSPAPVPLYTPVAYQEMAQPAEFFVVTWFKEQTLIKIGALIFFLGAVWFVSYSISQDWIPPSTPVYVGLIAAMACYAAGIWRKTVEEGQYLVLTTLGTGIVLASVCSAQFVYQPALFPALIALLLMVMSLVYTVRVSVEASAEWLATTAALAGFWIPFLLGTTISQPLFLSYLFVMATGLSLVVCVTRWRVVSLVLVIGCSFFELAAAASHGVGQLNSATMWFFMILFAGLFTTTTTISLYRSATPEPIDIALLAIVGVVYALGAHTLSQFPSMAFFVAALLLAGVGYVLSGLAAQKRVVAVYVCFASAAWLLGTGQLFSGYTQLLAFTIEITGAFLLLTALRLSERAVYLSMATFAIPVTISLSRLYSPLWQSGVWHLDALATTVMALSLLGSALWVLEQARLRSERWALPVAGTLASVGFLYTLLLLMQVAVSSVAYGYVFGYILWFGFMFGCLYYTLGARLSTLWSGVVFASMVMPLVLSMRSLSAGTWRMAGILHADALGVYAVTIFGVLVTLLCITSYRHVASSVYRRFAVIACVATTIYSFMVIVVFWEALFVHEVAAVLTYCSYALVLYVLITASFKLRAPLAYVLVATVAGILPLWMSLGSMQISLWGGSILQPHATGLYLMTALMIIIGLRFLTYTTEDEAEKGIVRRFAVTLFALSGIFSTIIVWLIAHVLSPDEGMAVTIALFVYTIVGLGLYIEGSRRVSVALKYSGMSLLVVVIARLGLIDVWTMEILWRIATFLGIGILFMLAALLEKKKI